MKIVINRCYGGFGLSPKATKMIMERKGLNCYPYVQTKYEWRDGVKEYTKTDIESLEDNLFVSFSKTDLGETTPSISNEDFWSYYKLDRTDKDMIEVIEQLGCKANGKLSDLVIVEVPDDVEWEIDDYDGMETVHEVHRSWC